MKSFRERCSIVAFTAPLLIALVLLGVGAETARADGVIIYVDRDAAGAGDGTSWADAYPNLQDGLDAASAGDEIWVAAGVYTPTNVAGENASFHLMSGVALYGGFAGGETYREQRDWSANVTVLSGDLGGDDTTDAHGVVAHWTHIAGANAYHVVVASAVDAAVLDGFTITAGWASLDSGGSSQGGGLYDNGGNPTLRNLTFSGNRALRNGGGMYVENGSPTLFNVVFSNNYVDSSPGGGGMYAGSGNPTLINVTFDGNSAGKYGGGMYDFGGHSTLINVVFSSNTAVDSGGGMQCNYTNPLLINVTFSDNAATDAFSGVGGGMYIDNSYPTLINSILWGNTAHSSKQMAFTVGSAGATIRYSLIQDVGICSIDSVTCDHVIGDDPLFGAGLRLTDGSPAIDAGDNSALPQDIHDLDDDGNVIEPLPFDRAGGRRQLDHPRSDTGNGAAPLVDMGAYEKPVLALDKRADPTIVESGDPLTYVITFQNDSTYTVTDALITDVVPAHLTDLDFTSSGALIMPTGSFSYTWAVQDLAAGGGGVITVTGTLNASALPGRSFDNVAVFTGRAGGVSVDSVASVTVARHGADLAVGKRAAHDPAVAGAPLTYTLTITNHGFFGATDIVLTDTLPSETTFLSASPGCSADGGRTVTCTLSWLKSHATAAFTIVVTAPATTVGQVVNVITATAATPDPDLANNAAAEVTRISAEADLSLDKCAAPDPVLAGGLLTYTLLVTNHGPDIAGEVTLNDALPTGTLPAGRLLALPLNEAQGSAHFSDVSGFGHHAICNQRGGSCPKAGVPGLYDTVLSFDGLDDWVEITDFDIGNDFTISLWVYPLDSGDRQAFIAKHTAAGGNLFILGFYNDGYYVNLRDVAYQAGTKVANAWQHLAVVGRQAGPASTEITLYKDGQPLWQRELAAVVGDFAGRGWTIGQEWDGDAASDFFHGAIDEVHIYNRPLTADEIAALQASHPNVSPIGSQGTCALGAGSNGVTCALGVLAAGAVATVTFPVQVSPTCTEVLSNTAVVSSYVPDPVPANNASTTHSDIGGDLALHKSGAPDPVHAGGRLTYTLSITNRSASTVVRPLPSVTVTNASNVSIAVGSATANPYPTTIAVSGVPGALVKTAVTLHSISHDTPQDLDVLLVGPSGQTLILMSDAGWHPAISNVTLTFDDDAPGYLPLSTKPSPGSYKPTDYAGAEGPDVFPAPAPGGPYGNALSVFDGSDPNGDWRLYIVDDYPDIDGGNIAGGWSLHLWTASTATVVDTLPEGVAFVSAPPGCAESGGVLTCTLGILGQGDSVELPIVVTTPLTAGVITNTATVIGLLPDLTPADNTATATTRIAAADLAVSKRAWPDPVVAGGWLTYTFVITNHGPDASTDVLLTDALPPAVMPADPPYVAASQGTCNVNDNVLRCDLGELGANAVATATLRVRVDEAHTGPVTNTAHVSGDMTDLFLDNNQATQSTPVGEIDLLLSKTVTPQVWLDGAVVTYTVRLTNDGPAAAQHIVVHDSLPGPVTFGGYTATVGVYTETTGVWRIGALAAGSNATLTLTGAVGTGRPGERITNTAALSESQPADILTHNNSTVAVGTWAFARLAVAKTVDAGEASEAPLGGVVTYTLHLSNEGDGIAKGVVMTDSLPPGVAFGAWVVQDSATRHAQTVSWGPRDVAAHTAYTISFTAHVTSSFAFAGRTITNTAHVTASNADPAQDSAEFDVRGLLSIYLPLVLKD